MKGKVSSFYKRKRTWDQEVWEALLCSTFTFPGRSYLITVLNPKNNLSWLAFQAPFAASFSSTAQHHLRWIFVFIVHLHLNGNKCTNAGILSFVHRVSLISRTPLTLYRCSLNGQIRRQIKKETNEWININLSVL